MKNILIMSAVYPPEPVVSAKLSKDLYQALKELGYGVKVLHPIPTRPNGFMFEKEIKHGTDEIVVESYTCPQSSLIGRFKESISFGRACSKYIKMHNKEIDVVYSVSWPIFASYYITKSAKKYRIPSVVHIQDVYPEALTNKLPSLLGKIVNGVLSPFDNYTFKHSRKLIAISDQMKNHLLQTRSVESDKICVVINWQDEKDFINYQLNNPTSAPNDKFTMMYMGNIGPVAGVDLLIEAFVKLNNPQSRLVIAGSGSVKEMLKEQAAKTPEADIQFWDVPDGKVPEVQSKADVLLLPIKKGAALTSIPSKLPAYMFSAKPIIGSVDYDCDTAVAIRESGGGFVVEPENANLLRNKMEEVSMLDKQMLEEMGAKGQKYAMTQFSKTTNLKKFVEIILEVLNDK